MRTFLAPAMEEVRAKLAERDHRPRTEAKGRTRLVYRLKALRLLHKRYAGRSEAAAAARVRQVADMLSAELRVTHGSDVAAAQAALPWAIPDTGERRQWPGHGCRGRAPV